MNPQNESEQPDILPQPAASTQPQAAEANAQAQPADNGWMNIPPKPVEPVKPKTTSKKKKLLVTLVSIVVGFAVLAGIVMFVQDKRADAAQAKLQRESRIVVL